MNQSNNNKSNPATDLSLILPLSRVPRAPARPVRVIGIDLGTTNSTVTVLTYVPGEDPPKARCIEVEQPTQQGIYIHHLVPSVVALHQGTVYIGEGAKRLRALAGDPKSELRRNRTIFWDCKNDMGLKRTYAHAPEGYRSSPEIASHLLRYLRDAAALPDGPPMERIVVTVPASFNAAQRQDTLKAAQAAGFDVGEGDFLDEPVAAFLNYLANPEVRGLLTPGKEQNLVVFDFGGGTCDVAVLRLCLSQDGNQFAISPLAVSRYHRLGGGDIDAAILHEALIPQIREQNNLAPFDLDFEVRKHQIEPAFLSLAETLKIGLCTDIRRLRAFHKYDPDKRETVVKKVPGVNTVRLKDGRELRLESPTLNAKQFEEILEPFLDIDLLFHRETEYRITCSIFAPLMDALDSAQLDEDQVDLCLLVGGSCLIPQVVDAVKGFFPRARVLSHESEDDIQTAVARGAAYHALSLALFGQGLVEPVAGDSVSIRTSSGPMELIPRGAPLPYPGDAQWAVNRNLQVPETSLGKPLELHVELLNGQGHSLMNKKWNLQPGIQRGDPLILECRMDKNQTLSFRLEVEGRPDQRPLELEIENPSCHAVHPNERIVRIEELEEEIRTKTLSKDEKEGKVLEIAGHCSELGQRDKAMTLIQKVLQSRGPDAGLLNRLGMLAGEMGDTDREIKFYREAAKASSWSGSLFNLALAYKRQKRYKEAQEALDEALDKDPDGPYWILKAQLYELQKQPREKDEALQEAFAMMGSLKQMNEWELGWYEYAAHLAEKTDLASDIKKELNTRKKKGLATSTGKPILPEIRSAMQRRED